MLWYSDGIPVSTTCNYVYEPNHMTTLISLFHLPTTFFGDIPVTLKENEKRHSIGRDNVSQ